MSLLNGGTSEVPLSTDGLTHLSTLASSSTASGPAVWKKSSPLKTYSKKTVSPVTVTPPLEADSDDKSRYGRARKFIQSGDFLSTDKKVSQYLKIQTENQFHNYRVTYSNSKARSVPKKPKTPRKSAPPILARSFSMASVYLPQAAGNEDPQKTASSLDLAAPTCTETVETPLPLQEFESDSDSEEVPQDYSVGDLVWAAIPTYPYWPAIITRDPVTSMPYKINGSGKSTKILWHVHFFGDKGMRGWVVTRNTFIFDGLESYNKSKTEYLANIAQKSKKKQKILVKAYKVPVSYSQSWASAVNEARSLLECSRSDRLEYLISTYAPKLETLKKRQRSLSVCDLRIPKKARMSEPPQRRKSLVSKTTKALNVASSAVTIKSLGISSCPHAVVSANPRKALKACEEDLQTVGSAESEIPSSPARDKLAISPDSALESSGEPSQPPSSETPKRSRPKRKSMETRSAQTSPMNAGLLPLVIEVVAGSDEPRVKAEDDSSQNIIVTSDPVEGAMKSSTTLLEGVRNLASSGNVKKRKGRPKKVSVTVNKTQTTMKSPNKPVLVDSQLPAQGVQDSSVVSLDLKSSGKAKQKRGSWRKQPIISKEPSPKNSPPLVGQRASLPMQSQPLEPIKRPRGRPRKISLPVPASGAQPSPVILNPVPVTATPTPVIPPPTITRSGRRSNKPVVLTTFTSPKGRKQEPKTEHLSVPAVVKEEPVSPTRVKSVPVSPATTPATKRKRMPEKDKKKKKIKLESNAECSLDESLVNEELDLSKSLLKVESAAKPIVKESPRTQQMKRNSLFAGVKDGKLCSICFKPGQVRRCRGPCCLYMHEECSDKRRFVPDCNTVQEDSQGRKKKTRKRLIADMRKACLEKSKEESYSEGTDSSNGLENNVVTPEMRSVEMKPVNGIAEDSVSATDSESDKIDGRLRNEQMMVNQVSIDSGLSNGPTNFEQIRLNSAKIIDKAELCLDNICRLNGQRSDENNLEEDELVLHLSEPNSFPESSGIPTPPPDENAKSPDPESNGGVCPPLNLGPDGLAILDIKADLGNCPIDSAESLTSDASEKDKNDTSKKEGKDKGWVCNMCQEGKLGPCFACGKDDDGERVRCKTAMCGKVFHLECTKDWPQHTKKQTAAGKLIFNCPAHTCHTCISDNPASLTSRYLNDKLVRCMRCPTTYHHSNFCVPAGSEILSSTQIICPRHFRQGKKSLSPVNASWCFLCSMGGSLICCDLCPNSFHVECLKISPPEGAYICEDCETGRFPLYGEIVWAKLGNYRWWPARILFPFEIPASLQRVEHVPGEFVVRFYGTYNYYWLHRGRVFLFHDGDGKKQESISLHSKKHSDGVFNRGVEEANRDFIIWTGERSRREETVRTSMKPPKYVKISSNKPVGSVKMNEADASSLTACDCKPDHKDPCGPESDCINRLLLVECSPQICPAGEKCNNKNFEKRLYPPLAPFRTEYRGWGLKTLGPLKKGDFIIEYVGEMIDEEEYKRRLQEMQRSKDENFYFLTLDKDRMLDAGPKGNLSRFMNHSCQPNCETQKWTVEGNTRVGLFALQNIPADSELVFNYNLMTTGDNKLLCRCGAPTCAGFIGGKPAKPPPRPKDDSSSNKLGSSRQRAKKKKTRKKNLTKVALTNSSAIGALSKSLLTKEEIRCYACHEGGATIACQDPSCPQLYHLACLGLSKDPSKKLTCPWHECCICGSRNKVENCSLCINAYCSEHHEGNIILNRGKGSLCHNHNMSDSGSDWSTGEREEDAADCNLAQVEPKRPATDSS